MKICRWLIELFLLVILIAGGCYEKPPTGTTADKVQGILNDTADDLELGAKVRTLVEKQELGKPCVHQRALMQQQPTQRYTPLYPVNSIIFGMTFIIWVAILLDIVNGRQDEKAA